MSWENTLMAMSNEFLPDPRQTNFSRASLLDSDALIGRMRRLARDKHLFEVDIVHYHNPPTVFIVSDQFVRPYSSCQFPRSVHRNL
jgi:hypothetical protein